MEILEKILHIALSLVIALVTFVAQWLGFGEPSTQTAVDKLNLKKNIVVMGVDERSGDVGRSDTLFVVMLDPKTDKPALLSIPRDTLVKIKGHGWDKINHAYAFGGHKATMETVENFLGLKINNYVLIDFKGFVGLVDAIGGVDIDVEQAMHYSDPYDGNDGLIINIPKGKQHLDGKHAIQYARYRDEEGDIGRIKRQQKFMRAFYAKLLEPATLLNAPNIMQSMASMVKTDLSITDLAMLGKAIHAGSNGMEGLAMDMVPGRGADIEEINYWIPDMTELRSKMVQLQGANMSNSYWASAQSAKQEYDRLLGGNSDKNATKGKGQVIKAPKSEELKAAVKAAKESNNLGRITGKRTEGTTSAAEYGQTGTKANPSFTPVRIKLINCSGSPGALAVAASQIERVGLVVVSRSSGSEINNTQIMVGSRDNKIISKLNGLSFRYALRISSGSTGAADAVIYLGKDFLGK